MAKPCGHITYDLESCFICYALNQIEQEIQAVLVRYIVEPWTDQTPEQIQVKVTEALDKFRSTE